VNATESGLEKITAGDAAPSRDALTPAVPVSELASALAASQLSSSDDLTRPLIAPVVAFNASDEELTRPLPEAAGSGPYGSDMDFTKPRLVGVAPQAPSSPVGNALPMLVLPPPPKVPVPAPVPVVVSVPPRSAKAMEHAPSIQIAEQPTDRYRDRLTTLPRIPRPAPVPSFEPRSPNPSVVPVAGSVFPPAQPSRRSFWIAIAAAVLGVGALGIALRPRTGSLVVTVSGPTGAAVRGVSIQIDGVERCTATPCVLDKLTPGSHLVSASATGLPPSAERALVINAGEHAAQHVTLDRQEEQHAGLSVAAVGDGLRVLVDGREVGAPPVSLADIEPGSHSVRVVGDSRYYAPYEETVKLDRAEVRSIGPVRLHLLKGRLELSAGDGAAGAQIAVDGKRIGRLPAVLELSADDSHEVTAVKRGFTTFDEQVVFDGSVTRAVSISMAPGDATEAGHAPVLRAAANVRPGASTRTAIRAASPVSSMATGVGTLNLTSTPPAKVVLNGRPIGETPLRVKVSPGKQTVLFVLPGHGRKLAVANVGPGGRAAVGVKF